MRSLENIDADIVKTKTKVAEFSTRLKKLEQEKRDAEDANIIRAVREGRLTDSEFAALMRRFRQESVTQATPNIKNKEEQTQ